MKNPPFSTSTHSFIFSALLLALCFIFPLSRVFCSFSSYAAPQRSPEPPGRSPAIAEILEQFRSLEQQNEAKFLNTSIEDLRSEASSLTVLYDVYGLGCSGFALESIAFIEILHKFLPHFAVLANRPFCPGLPKETEDILSLLSDRSISGWSADLLISHRPPQFYFREFPAFLWGKFIEKKPRFIVGRSMSEVTEIPNSWVFAISSLVDQVWLPSRSGLSAFLQAGVPVEKLRVLPEPINFELFNWSARSAEERRDPFLTKGKRAFNFLSVFKIEPRKGWQELLLAFFEEFRPEEPVTLFLHTFLHNSDEPRNPAAIQRALKNFLDSVDWPARGLERSSLPWGNVELVTQELDTNIMPRLYAAVDAFVLPSRGEGFGLPLAEALAMRLPVIATAWGGQMEFLTEENSFLIPVERFQPAEGPEFDSSQFWALASVKNLRQILRFVYENPRESARRAENGRAAVAAKLSAQALEGHLLRRIVEIKRILKPNESAGAAGAAG